MMTLDFRLVQRMLAMLTLTAFSFAFYGQYVLGFLPCPLCLMQRCCALLWLFAYVAGRCLKSRRHFKIIVLMQAIVSMAGLFFAGRQGWLESLANEDSMTCLPGFAWLIQHLPWQKMLTLFLWGSQSCGAVAWHVGGISMTIWSVIYFSVMILSSFILYRNIKQEL